MVGEESLRGVLLLEIILLKLMKIMHYFNTNTDTTYKVKVWDGLITRELEYQA